GFACLHAKASGLQTESLSGLRQTMRKQLLSDGPAAVLTGIFRDKREERTEPCLYNLNCGRPGHRSLSPLTAAWRGDRDRQCSVRVGEGQL
ncbi:hypothetical protein KUCAC02_003820, partial [Chaenocephalus aceratus]